MCQRFILQRHLYHLIIIVKYKNLFVLQSGGHTVRPKCHDESYITHLDKPYTNRKLNTFYHDYNHVAHTYITVTCMGCVRMRRTDLVMSWKSVEISVDGLTGA